MDKMFNDIIKEWNKQTKKENISFENLIKVFEVDEPNESGGFFSFDWNIENIQELIDGEIKDNTNILTCLSFRFSQCSYTGYQGLMGFMFQCWTKYKYENNPICNFRKIPKLDVLIGAWCYMITIDIIKNNSMREINSKDDYIYNLRNELYKYYDLGANVRHYHPTSGNPKLNKLDNAKHLVKIAIAELKKLIDNNYCFIIVHPIKKIEETKPLSFDDFNLSSTTKACNLTT